MANRIFIICCLLVFHAGTGYSQVAIDSSFSRYARQLPQQKIHLHFDNEVYVPGQTVWYKAYVFSGTEPSGFSKNLYVDWYDDNGKYITRSVSPISHASANASITIPEKYTGRKLKAVAYTQWMLNFDPEFLCSRTIDVVPSVKREPATGIKRKTTLGFFPEGGDMIEGTLATIAFKATDQSGYPVNLNGVIVNRSGEQVTEFNTRHDGMGIVKLMPAANESYTAEWRDVDGSLRKTMLPPAKPDGIMLAIGKGFSDRPFVIQRSANAPESVKKLYLVVQSHEQIVFKANINLSEKTEVNSQLPASRFPSGIAQVTLFDINWQPVTERLIFVNNGEYKTDAAIRFDTLNLAKRGKNVIELSVNDTTPATYSLSVMDDAYGYSANNSIITDLLLTSDIKGYVHNPAYYFSSLEDSLAAQLDLVMLTNGWRRFAWKDVLEARKPDITHPMDTNYLSLRGRIEGISKEKLEKAKTVNLVFRGKDSSKQFVFLPINPDGYFQTDNLLIFDTATVYYKLNNEPLYSKGRFGMITNFLPVDTAKRINALDHMQLAEIPDAISVRKKILAEKKDLNEVVVYTKVKSVIEQMDDRYTGGMFKGDAYQFNLADDPTAGSSLSVYNYLQSRVGGLRIITDNINTVTVGWTSSAKLQGVVAPLLYLDEFEISDPKSLFSLLMSDVAYIKVFRPPFAAGPMGGPNGAIAIYTKKGSDLIKGVKGLNNTIIAGYTVTKEFYSPDYSQINPSLPDTRATLLWNPDIITDGSQKKIQIPFYNNDVTHSFRVVLEGMNDDGKLIHISTVVKQ